MSDRISIYSTDQLFEAELLKGHLANDGIVAFILNQKDSAYHFGSIELLVDQKDVMQAKRIIEKYFANE